ncbi:antA/AntB antirepressor family protein [Methylovulum psychrotolerans]|uniref:antA/AntB antirepressor family protein n=1 Tax=Methylovulum psychrotolerans TaxID=1704499 RepID=UPI001476341D|nr:antA/AntB antirepressor family protein [Methylovulum psychrotolerans]
MNRDFLVWVKNSIAEYGFVEGLDFLLPQMGEKENAGLQTTIDYHLLLDTANVLARLEKDDQGRAALRAVLLARAGKTRPAPWPTAQLPDKVPLLRVILVGLGIFICWGLFWVWVF